MMALTVSRRKALRRTPHRCSPHGLALAVSLPCGRRPTSTPEMACSPQPRPGVGSSGSKAARRSRWQSRRGGDRTARRVVQLPTDDGEAVKAIEATTNQRRQGHGVLAQSASPQRRGDEGVRVHPLSPAPPEDINNTSHALMLAEGRDRDAAAGARRGDRPVPRVGPRARRPADAVAHPRPARQPDPRSARRWPSRRA